MDHAQPAPKALPTLTLLEQRAIEANIAGPLIRAFSARFGESETLAVVRQVVTELARSSGEQLAAQLGDDGLPSFARGLERWKEGGALELEVLEATPERLDFNVNRCRYAEMYRALGLQDLGASLSCCRDFALIEGFNPSITLERTQTLMEGAPFCDFRFRSEETGLSESG